MILFLVLNFGDSNQVLMQHGPQDFTVDCSSLGTPSWTEKVKSCTCVYVNGTVDHNKYVRDHGVMVCLYLSTDHVHNNIIIVAVQTIKLLKACMLSALIQNVSQFINMLTH